MSSITIQTIQPGLAWRFGGITAELRLYANQTFITSDGTLIQQGTYKSVTCTVSGTTIVIPSFTLDSTTNSSNPNANYTARIYDSNGVRRWLFPANMPTFRLDFATLGASTSWELISDYNLVPTPTFFNYPQVVEIIADMVTDRLLPVSDASAATKGKTRLSFDPVSAAQPIAVGENDPVWTGIKQTEYLSSYASLAAAITAIGSVTPTMLKITSSVTISANTTITPNIFVVLEGDGAFSVNSARTLTIGAMANPGSRQVFSGNGAVRFSAGAVPFMNLAWRTGADSAAANSTTVQTAINEMLASAIANLGGVIYIPEGNWVTKGDHAVCDNLIIFGDGLDVTNVVSEGAMDGIFTHGANVYHVKVKDLTLDGNGETVSGYLCSAANGDGSAGRLSFESVRFTDCEYGFRIFDTVSTEWQMATVSFDAKCVLANNAYGLWCNTTNNVIDCKAFFEVAANQWASYATGAGQWRFAGNEFGGSLSNKAWQIESQTIVAAAGITVAGIAQSVVTAAGMIGSPKTVEITVDTTMTTAALIATAFRLALGNDPSVTSFFHIGGTVAEVQLIALDPAANSATMNFTIKTVTATGITNSATSTNTVAGVADSTQAQGFYFSGTHGLITFEGVVEEQFRNFLVSDVSDETSSISIIGSTLQDAIRLNGLCQLRTIGCTIQDRTIRDNAAGSAKYVSAFDTIPMSTFFSGAFRTLSARYPSNFNGNTSSGSGQIAFDLNQNSQTLATQYKGLFYHNDTGFFDPRTDARLASMSSVDPAGGDNYVLLRVGRCSSTGEPLFYYDIYRDYVTGYLHFAGNQTGFRAYVFNAAILMSSDNAIDIGAVAASRPRTGYFGTSVTAPTFTASMAITPAANDGAPLGDTTHNFSDLFLATGAVINYANGNVVITHSGGILTVTTGDLRVTTAGTNAASVVTVGGTQTLTNKTLTAPVIGVATGTSLAVTGAVTSSGTAGIGYATGAGGTVTQATSKSTGVTLDKICGAITMNNAALADATNVSFTVTNSTVAATDNIVVNHASAGTAGAYQVQANNIGAGSFQITVRNVSGGGLSEAIVISYQVHKGVTS